jgi:peptide-methionine (R)-S-oxide reductase
MKKLPRTNAEWREQLDDETYRVTREGGTERPYTGRWWNANPDGIYHCACCHTELFDSEGWFASHCGWPSFDRELPEARIERRVDRSHGMVRVEIVCGACGAHLGHVFPDGPTESGERYCVNSVALLHSIADADRLATDD